MNPLRLGTRKSPLALWQAEHVRHRLMSANPGLDVELVRVTTEGDRILDRSLSRVGGKGLFIKELEQALLDGQIDLAVHSLKDMTVHLPDSLHLAAILEREDPRDAFVSNRHDGLAALPPGARVGTASLRRQCQLRATRPDLEVITLRGNVNTRLAKLDAGEYDAILLAAAGLIRLGFEERIRARLSPSEILPAVGQGAVCVESRRADERTNHLLESLNHAATRLCVGAERALNAELEGGCQVPIGGYAVLEGNDTLYLRGLVGDPDGSRVVRGETRGAVTDGERLGRELAQSLLARGAREILQKVYAGG